MKIWWITLSVLQRRKQRTKGLVACWSSCVTFWLGLAHSSVRGGHTVAATWQELTYPYLESSRASYSQCSTCPLSFPSKPRARWKGLGVVHELKGCVRKKRKQPGKTEFLPGPKQLHSLLTDQSVLIDLVMRWRVLSVSFAWLAHVHWELRMLRLDGCEL